jgi:hypothetical protein
VRGPLHRWIPAFLALPALALAPVLVGCGDDGAGTGSTAAAVAPPTFIQPARAGSFLGGSGPQQELILRGVGGAAAVGAEGSGGGGAAGAVATSVLVRRAHQLLGPEPFEATLAGAEVLPQRYSLELRNPRYDGVRQELTFDATILGGNPELAPPSFGASTLTIASSLPGHELAGTVTGIDPSDPADEGEPLGGALVTASIGGLGLATAETGADGSFSIGPLPAGSYEVEADERGYELDRAERSLPAPSEPLELELKAEQQVAQQG